MKVFTADLCIIYIHLEAGFDEGICLVTAGSSLTRFFFAVSMYLVSLLYGVLCISILTNENISQRIRNYNANLNIYKCITQVFTFEVMIHCFLCSRWFTPPEWIQAGLRYICSWLEGIMIITNVMRKINSSITCCSVKISTFQL